MSEHSQGRRPRGRPAGSSTSRARILTVALTQFSEHGYGGTSLRNVARAADVDVSLVTHFFGNKAGLFTSSLEMLQSVPDGFITAVRGGRDGLPRRLTESFFAAWESPETGPSLRAVLRAASESPVASNAIAGLLEDTLLRGEQADDIDGVAVQAMLGQLLGLAFSRYLLRIRPIADLPVDALVTLATAALEATMDELTNLQQPRQRPAP